MERENTETKDEAMEPEPTKPKRRRRKNRVIDEESTPKPRRKHLHKEKVSEEDDQEEVSVTKKEKMEDSVNEEEKRGDEREESRSEEENQGSEESHKEEDEENTKKEENRKVEEDDHKGDDEDHKEEEDNKTEDDHKDEDDDHKVDTENSTEEENPNEEESSSNSTESNSNMEEDNSGDDDNQDKDTNKDENANASEEKTDRSTTQPPVTRDGDGDGDADTEDTSLRETTSQSDSSSKNTDSHPSDVIADDVHSTESPTPQSEQTVTPPPIFESLDFSLSTKDTRIFVTPEFGSLSSLTFVCSIVLKGERIPSVTRMQSHLQLLGQELRKGRTQGVLELRTADVHGVDSIVCLGHDSRGIFYGPTRKTLQLESPRGPELHMRVIDETPVSLEIYVRSTMEARVWCRIDETPSQPFMTVELVKTGKQRFVRDRAAFFFDDLAPNSEYGIWCFAESKTGVSSSQSLQETHVTAKTLESGVFWGLKTQLFSSSNRCGRRLTRFPSEFGQIWGKTPTVPFWITAGMWRRCRQFHRRKRTWFGSAICDRTRVIT